MLMFGLPLIYRPRREQELRSKMLCWKIRQSLIPVSLQPDLKEMSPCHTASVCHSILNSLAVFFIILLSFQTVENEIIL